MKGIGLGPNLIAMFIRKRTNLLVALIAKKEEEQMRMRRMRGGRSKAGIWDAVALLRHSWGLAPGPGQPGRLRKAPGTELSAALMSRTLAEL